MPELPDRFRALDDLEPPDIAERARALGPRPPTEPEGPSRAKRTTVIVVAFVVAVAGVGLLFRAFREEATTAPGAAPSQELIALSVTVPSHPVGSVIALVHPDGSSFHVLTRASSTAPDVEGDPWMRRYGFAADDGPTWSPDGTTIAFRRSYAEGVDSLCTITTDGDRFRILVRNLQGAEIAWSPDGSKFAYYSERDGGVHVMNADGSDDHAVAPVHAQNQGSPSWSPDGRLVYFTQGKIYAVHPDGTGLHEVIDAPWFISTAFVSPDGATVAFGGGIVPTRGGGDIWLADTNGSNRRRLTSTDDWTLLGWAQDPARVMLARATTDGVTGFWTIGTDGAGLTRVKLPEGIGGPLGTATSWAP